MKHTTLFYLVRDFPRKQVLVGLKKRGFGSGKLNGFGGKAKNNERVKDAALRELFEETGIIVEETDAKKVAELRFRYPHLSEDEGGHQLSHVFLADNWDGEPVETEEMKPVWVDIKKIPFDKMWPDDEHWFPRVLKNILVKAEFTFDKNNSIVDYKLTEVDEPFEE